MDSVVADARPATGAGGVAGIGGANQIMKFQIGNGTACREIFCTPATAGGGQLKFEIGDIPDCLVEHSSLGYSHAVAEAAAAEQAAAAPVIRDRQADELEIKRLAKLSPLDYAREREKAAAGLALGVTVLDRLVRNSAEKQAPATGQGRPISFPEVEPWPKPVNGAELLDELCSTVRRHVVLPAEAGAAVALWICFSWLFDSFDIAPKLAITSPEKRCGKSTLMDLLAGLTRKPLSTSNTTSAAIFRVIEIAHPTLLVDEADAFAFNSDKPEMRGILNSGHRRSGAFVLRTVGDTHEPRMFSTWAPMAIALIGRLPDTLEDRSIPVELRRRRPDEAIVPLAHGTDGVPLSLARKAARWCADVAGDIRWVKPAMPAGLFNRQADNWRPLLAIADTAGGEWPERARQAAKALTMVGAGDDQSNSVMLLSDIRNLFDSRRDDKITTKDMLDGLVAIEERPWPEWRGGKPISPAALAKLLASFGVVPVNLKVADEKVLKGYRRGHFEDAFTRYLPFPPIAAATPLLRPSNGHNSQVSQPLPGGGGSGCENSEKANNHRQSSGVAAAKPPWDEIDECEGVEAAHPKAGSVTL